MNLDKVFVSDIESIGYLDELKSFEDLHVLSCCYLNSEGKWDIKSTKEKSAIQTLLGNPNNTVLFHNGVCYDKPALEIMGIKFKAEIIDTLVLSQYLYSERDKHGLESWGDFFNVPKPKITDWKNLSYDEYRVRCEEDCKINTNLWVMILTYLRELYETDEEIINLIKYLNHKAYMLHLQDRNPILIDVPQCEKNLAYLESIIKEKEDELNSIMPKTPIKSKRIKPKKLYNKDGSLSEVAKKWKMITDKINQPIEYDGKVEVITGWVEPNCQSSTQMKRFLLDSGWIPTMFKDGANGKVAQLRDDDKNLCPNIEKLIEQKPQLESLNGLSRAQHRAGYLKSMLKHVDENGYAKAWAHAFTRTLRLKHVAPFVNLPKPNTQYGELVRSVMIAPKGYVCFGADLSSIEDKCKQISIFQLDRPYVESMNSKGWDAHLTLGLKAGMFTEDEVQFYKWYNNKEKEENIYTCPDSLIDLTEEDMLETFHVLSKKRSTSKTANYALTYGCGVAKLMESTELPRKDAEKLHKGYHDINWSVKKFAETRIVKTIIGKNWLRVDKKAGGLIEVNETKWIWNEYSKLWLFLKNDKDRFAACNSNFGVKVFDVWSWFLIQGGIKFSYQAHDEQFWYCPESEVDNHIKIIEFAIKKTNDVFNPPIPLECDYKIGENYSKVH
jgi:hypothetical protein